MAQKPETRAGGSASRELHRQKRRCDTFWAVWCGKLIQAKRGRRGNKIWRDRSAGDMGWCWMACGCLQFEQISGTMGHQSEWVLGVQGRRGSEWFGSDRH
jgi:hypothetical protein